MIKDNLYRVSEFESKYMHAPMAMHDENNR